ncbi:winged helix-turn-helix domain-containing protein [Micromonospora carbonacea]|uniref:winged helix-turn-helix domain-containing protein n=1 Tax=Micromonospora carbonacea TaxID=47853 RepID=UPI003D95B588
MSIEPRAFTLLCYLVGRRHRVVSRQELLTSTWTGEVVSEAVLASAVRAIRYGTWPNPTCRRSPT